MAVARGARRAAIAFCSRTGTSVSRAMASGAVARAGRGPSGRGLDTARFASTLAILTGSGAPLLRSLDAARDVIWAFRSRARQAGRQCTSRGRFAGARVEGAARFPPVLCTSTANGEPSGQLAAMLQRAAEELERDAERRMTWFAALLQPALIVTMGAIVLVLVLAVMLPIVAMNQLIR